MKETTKIIQSGGFAADVNGKFVRTINPPLYEGSTLLFKNYEDFKQARKGAYKGITYGTDRLPNQRIFEDAICELEGGELTRAFQSGISAITHTILGFTKAGDHLLVCDNVYGPTARFCKKILTRYQVETSFIPADIGAGIESYIKPHTRMIFLESPGSNTFEIQDIPAITRIAREKNIITVLDNTWATPLYLRAFDLGIDVSIQSVTKYISGHSDLLMGTATLAKTCATEFSDYYRWMEIHTSSRECSLALRGLKTLELRLKQHERSALKVAQWLETQPLIETVLHPALPSHPQHHLWQRDFKGASGLFAFIFKQDYTDSQLALFVNALKLFGIGYSWGGYKSLITVGEYMRETPTPYKGRTLVRLNIGLEDADDLIHDLDQGLGFLAGL